MIIKNSQVDTRQTIESSSPGQSQTSGITISSIAATIPPRVAIWIQKMPYLKENLELVKSIDKALHNSHLVRPVDTCDLIIPDLNQEDKKSLEAWCNKSYCTPELLFLVQGPKLETRKRPKIDILLTYHGNAHIKDYLLEADVVQQEITQCRETFRQYLAQGVFCQKLVSTYKSYREAHPFLEDHEINTPCWGTQCFGYKG